MSRSLHQAVTLISVLFFAGMYVAVAVPRVALATEDVAPATQVFLEQRTVQAGPITIKVASQPSDTSLVLSIVLDTHSVDLDQYDLSQLASLRNDQGLELRTESWNAPKGGHHREGTLVFPLIGVDGIELIGPDVRGLELIVREIGGVPETVIQWTLAA